VYQRRTDPVHFTVTYTQNSAPIASIIADKLSGPAPVTIQFNGSNSSDSDGNVLSYLWDFGDGSTSKEVSPMHTFGKGSYEVSLTVSDSLDVDRTSVYVNAVNTSPLISLAVASDQAVEINDESAITGPYPLTLTFDASASADPNGDPLSFTWDFGDGASASQPTIAHTFGKGQFTVELVVSDGDLSTSATIEVNAINAAPIAGIMASDTTGQAPIQLSFDAGASTDPNGDAMTFEWLMGDGSTRQGQSVSHFYGAAGDYTVTLIASDGELVGTDSLTVSIASGVDTESFELPESFILKAAYPNPFNPTTTITYGLPAAAEVRISATDLLGRQVATLVAGDIKAAGYHTVQFNADGLASGTYLIRMEAGDFVATQQVVLLK